jgi:hypothetical protein
MVLVAESPTKAGNFGKRTFGRRKLLRRKREGEGEDGRLG